MSETNPTTQTTARRHAHLNALEPLVGEWDVQATTDGQLLNHSRTTFEWIEGGAFLKQYTQDIPIENAPAEWIENSPLPVTSIIGLDDTHERYTQLYADARGVHRIYQMTLEHGVWKLWRDAPRFSQRFTGRFSEDGSTITGYWEKSTDGTTWEHDFDLTYRKAD